MMKRLLAATSALVFAGALAYGANISLLTGPQPAGDLPSILNGLIQSINNGVSGVLSANITPVQTNVGTAEQILMTYTLPGNTISVGQGLRVRCWGSTGANGNNKTMKLYFGASSIATPTQASNAQNWFLNLTVMRNGSATQTVQGDGVAGTGSVTPVAVTAVTGSDDMTAPITIKCTGTDGTNSPGDIVAHTMLVESIR